MLWPHTVDTTTQTSPMGTKVNSEGWRAIGCATRRAGRRIMRKTRTSSTLWMWVSHPYDKSTRAFWLSRPFVQPWSCYTRWYRLHASRARVRLLLGLLASLLNGSYRIMSRSSLGRCRVCSFGCNGAVVLISRYQRHHGNPHGRPRVLPLQAARGRA